VATHGNAVDAGFFKLVHQQAIACRTDDERRDQARSPFVSLQRVAVRRGRGIPDDAEFMPVQCRDLSCRGFSFLLPERPAFQAVVVAFGPPEDSIYLAARVSHCADVWVESSGDLRPTMIRNRQPSGLPPFVNAEPMVLVGCRFLERLQR
jgi:hypothetical protein